VWKLAEFLVEVWKLAEFLVEVWKLAEFFQKSASFGCSKMFP